ncbi:MAG: hypothetical protein ABW131_13140 [Candidatus Sedimenticola sp. 6PFRAG5]
MIEWLSTSLDGFMRYAVLLLLALLSLSANAHSGLHERIQLSSEAIEQSPDNPRPWVRRAYLHAEQGDWQMAFDDLDKAEARVKDGGSMALHRAAFQYKRASDTEGWRKTAHLESARRELDEYLQHHATDSTAYLLHARVARDLGSFDLAAENFDKAISLSVREEAVIYLERAEVLINSDRADEALVGLREGIKRMGAPLFLLRKAIELEVGLGQPEEALALYELLPEEIRSSPDELMHKGDLLKLAGRDKEAVLAYCRARTELSAFPDWRLRQPAYSSLGKELSKRHDSACIVSH